MTADGARFITGVSWPMKSRATSPRSSSISARIFVMRAAGSGSPAGAEKKAPANLLPPSTASSPVRIATGIEIGMSPSSSPTRSW